MLQVTNNPKLQEYLGQIIGQELDEYYLEEDYPDHFDREFFAKLTSFAQRVKYCDQHLRKIGAGSSRIVYQIDDKMVLKLAKNAKGLAQNQTEERIGKDSYFTDIVAEVFGSHPNDQWLESEYCIKLKPTRFKQLTGVDINLLSQYLQIMEAENRGQRSWLGIDPEVKSQLGENEFVQKIVEIMHSYKLLAGDLGRLSSYGEAFRGEATVVISDYGFDEDVRQAHYMPKQRPAYRGW